LRVAAESGLATPSRSDVRKDGLDAAAASWTMRGEEVGYPLCQSACRVSCLDLHVLAVWPGGGRASPRVSPALTPGPAPRSGAA